MAVRKDKWNGYDGECWRVDVYFTDYKGIRKRHVKRGFKTKKEAKDYETQFIAKNERDINIAFPTFVDLYIEQMKPTLKLTTLSTKEAIINTHILPYFENKALSDISNADILQWQNELLGKRDEFDNSYSATYLRTVQNQLNAIFNFAERYFGLTPNPCKQVRKMGKAKSKEMLFWTKEEYLRFSEEMKDKPVSYYAFQILYWTGIRCGELLALTKSDFDMEKKQLRINKNYQVVKGEEHILSPKTESSNRIIDLPDFLCDEMEDYFSMLYRVDDDSRIFVITKSYLHHELDRGCKKSGVKRIRLHDLRHSACALLIELGYSPVQIAERLGHESITITQRYSHLYPTVQREMAGKLDSVFKEGM